ncbi:MAG: hypothetical protein ACUVQM_05250 [Candidatus Hadarchaeaceae archaeon]
MEVKDQRTGDGEILRQFVERASELAKVMMVPANAAYGPLEKFNLLEGVGIEPGIRPRRCSSDKSRGIW